MRNICTISDCGLVVFGHGYCRKHYYRWRTNGDPLVTRRIIGDDDARFWSKVDVGDCWEWTGALTRGYGHFMFKGKLVYAHRHAWALLVGDLSPDDDIDHLCKNPKCVNPDHLQPVPHRVNILRGESPAAKQARKQYCKRGHPLIAENLFPSKEGRHCRPCVEIRRAA